jgi:hypothetical protein
MSIDTITKTYIITPAAGKRLIAKALAQHPLIQEALGTRNVLIVAGTTNGYVAEEILASLGESGFVRRRFVRGITLPPGRPVSAQGRLPDESGFPGDVLIQKGVWVKGKTINDVIDEIQEGDIILKGANALDLAHKRAAILIGNPKLGTVGLALQAAVGRRARMILPVGLEKRVQGDLDALAQLVNAPGAQGPRLWPVYGEPFTELDAIPLLTGLQAELVSAGGVGGAEGCVWLAVSGTAEQMEKAEALLRPIAAEPMFEA